MGKVINNEVLSLTLEKKGLTQTELALRLNVSKQAVSKWLRGEDFPRPDKLLNLALLLQLKYEDFVINKPVENEPIVAFRKKTNKKITEKHIRHAKELGEMLKELVPFVPFDKEIFAPNEFKKPSTDYNYIQKVVEDIRASVGLGPEDPFDFIKLIKRFNDLGAIIIPVAWGEKKDHENALHIYLQDSMTTWIYLNIDSAIFDFKFWVAHELGHLYTNKLISQDRNKAEDFADAFASALLFPKTIAEKTYHSLKKHPLKNSKVNSIKRIASKYMISPISVYSEINKFAYNNELEKVDLNDSIYRLATSLKQKNKNIFESIFQDTKVDPETYIERLKDLFNTSFFDALKRVICLNKKSPAFVQNILDISLLDAKEIHAILC